MLHWYRKSVVVLHWYRQSVEVLHLYRQNVLALQPMLPSLLSMDVDGRVLRFDTFSKIIGPG